MSDNLAKQFCLFIFVFLWLSYSLIKWDIENYKDLLVHCNTPYYMQKLWNLAFALMISFLWGVSYIFFFILAGESSKITTYLKWSSIIVYGPNLLFWNIIGSANEGIRLSLPMTIFLWSVLYLISLGLTGFLMVKFFRCFCTALRNCTGKRALRKQLLHSVCSICIENFRVMEDVQMLPICRHLFHRRCIQIWMSDNPTCPVCRQIYN